MRSLAVVLVAFLAIALLSGASAQEVPLGDWTLSAGLDLSIVSRSVKVCALPLAPLAYFKRTFSMPTANTYRFLAD